MVKRPHATLAAESSGKRIGARQRQGGAYSLIETMMTMLIIVIISSMVFYSVQSTSDTSHLSMVSNRISGAMRYARTLAMSSGKPCNVDFNLTGQTINVYLGNSVTAAANPLFPGGACSLHLTSDQGIAGCTISSVSNCPTNGSNIYRCTYGVLGTRTNASSYSQPMTVTIAFGASSTTVTIPNVGDCY